ncbi:MAG: FAD-binding oxidoreductase [Actinomycetota bacterium]|nr:FAD-binding oxidoreductase [Actinomycetota bacterium]
MTVATQAKRTATALAARLRRTVDGEVRFDAGSRALYATDGSNYRQVPIGVVVPRDAQDIVDAVAACREYGAPVLARGGGTSLAGQCCNVAVVIDASKYMNGIVELDPDEATATVQPGLVLDDLRDAAERHHLTFAPDPSTHRYCTLGGMIGNNSCGIHSLMGGKTAENVVALDVLTYDGTELHVARTSEAEVAGIVKEGGRRAGIYRDLSSLAGEYGDLIRARYPDIPRRVSGYNLDQLLPENGLDVARALVGSESTCVLVLQATVRLVPSPPQRVLLVLGYPDVYRAADHVQDVLAYEPIGLEGIDDRLVHFMHKKGLHREDVELLPEGGGWLLAEFGGDTRAEASDRANDLVQDLRRQAAAPSTKLFDDPDEERMVWEIRESGLGATAVVPGEPVTWEGWEDAAVPPDRLGDYLRDFRSLLNRYRYGCSLYGHFGEGCIHTRIDFDLKTADGIAKFRSFVEEAADLVVSYGGSLSGEHGDGQSRAELLPKMFGDELVEAFGRFKAIWDPDNKMNPHKIVQPYKLDENLRLGTGYRPPTLATHFSFGDEGGSFAEAAGRCVGVGLCRRHDGGTMCPSYMVTREEKHTTRGRARMLFEMLQGDPLRRGWRDRAVKESLELCLACKGCKSECPVNVDMATYKAEFYSHYYKRRLRPRAAYAMGLVYWWARLASKAPRLANSFAHAPGLSRVVKALGGVAPQREIPRLARSPFTHWFDKRAPRDTEGRRVVLWPDTFNNYFHPEVAKAAVTVLEDAGCRVEIPKRPLCCGRPLYDFGMLPTAKRLLRQILVTMQAEIRGGVCFVGLEPSCTAVFRDELVDLFPHDEDARRLSSQFFTLAEFLDKIGYEPARLTTPVLVHGHCHHKAVMGLRADERILNKAHADYEIIDSGCCGLAGSFGFEAGDHYDVSVKAGERVLLPTVRNAPNDTLIMSDGFSCRTQVEHFTERTTLHLAQVLARGLDPASGPVKAI